jgi:cyclopropane-fatty-acyl-phospholipid synthase
MATPEQIEWTYDYQDEICRLSLGRVPSITCAMYDGDTSKTLEQAQEEKNRYILEAVRFRPGFRVLDVGCGWGAVLDAVRRGGGHGVGVTLSPRQAAACRACGLDAHVLDWRAMVPDTFGRFDAVVSLGAFEHFCTPEEYQAGEQEAVYRRYFRLCHDLLPPGGRMFLQTMLWGKKVPGVNEVRLDAPVGSDEYVLASLAKYYPGSWLPANLTQIATCAAPWFRLVSSKNGRRDYIETLLQFRRRVWRPSLPKLWCALKLLPRFLRDHDFRLAIRSFMSGHNRECFIRNIMDHERIVFESRPETGDTAHGG